MNYVYAALFGAAVLVALKYAYTKFGPAIKARLGAKVDAVEQKVQDKIAG